MAEVISVGEKTILSVHTNNGMSAYIDYLIMTKGGGLLYASIFDATKYRSNGVAAYCNGDGSPILEVKEAFRKVKSINCPYRYRAYAMQVSGGRDVFSQNVVAAENAAVIVTTNNNMEEDVYNYLMNTFVLPMRHSQEWMSYIISEAEKFGYVSCLSGTDCVISGDGEYDRSIELKGQDFCLSELMVIDFTNLDEDKLKGIMSTGAREGKLLFSDEEGYNPPDMQKIDTSKMDDYLQTYVDSISQNTAKSFIPLTDFAGSVVGLALKGKKPYPQQSMAVNAMKALKDTGSRYGFICAEMGSGKTLMGESIMESYYVEKAMKRYHLTAAEVYRRPELVNYRHIIMCPGHLVHTWEEDIKKEVPFAKVKVIKKFSDLTAIAANGKKRNGREFFIIGKDFCKLGASLAPIPTIYKEKQQIKIHVCKDCRAEHTISVKQYGQERCEVCNGTNWEDFLLSRRTVPAMLCPECGHALLNGAYKLGAAVDSEELEKYVLTPRDFVSHKASNHKCYHCGAVLWGVDCKTVNMNSEFSKLAEREPKWIKVKEYSGFSRKSTVTKFALKGHEEMAYKERKLGCGPAVYNRTRRVAPAQYIKNHLKGFFDMAILDEVHKYEGAGTAQSRAAEAIHKAASFTIGLTGTLTNGTAESLFYLFYMLDPGRMQRMGYTYEDSMAFSRKYGAVETEYESSFRCSPEEEGKYNSQSKGRAITQPKVKPGISPLVYAEFLLDKAVFLNITDFSNFLPKFTEQVVEVEEDPEVISSYKGVLGKLKSFVRTPEKGAALAGMLSCGLSYTDKPYGRKPIMSTKTEGMILAEYPSHDEYRTKLLKKEEKLVEIVNKEIAEDRNLFIYAVYTGQEESNILYRLQSIIEKECNLKGAVQVMESTRPKASDRADWIHKKASEGAKVFICNPSLVETGLDFKFDYEGKTYNYPTIVFYQIDYKLATFWQAGRRAFRLNQTEECRNYYFATKGTAQAIALGIMADKQMAASALQGNFSSEGLQAMSSSTDAQALLTKALLDGSSDDSMDLASKFDVLNEVETELLDNSILEEYRNVKNFYELTGLDRDDITDIEDGGFRLNVDVVDTIVDDELLDYSVKWEKSSVSVIVDMDCAVQEVLPISGETAPTADSFVSVGLFDSSAGFTFGSFDTVFVDAVDAEPESKPGELDEAEEFAESVLQAVLKLEKPGTGKRSVRKQVSAKTVVKAPEVEKKTGKKKKRGKFSVIGAKALEMAQEGFF